MDRIKILSDSSCDLPEELKKKYQIDILPIFINLGGTVYQDGIDINSQNIYDYVEKTNILPGTIACSLENFRKAFEKWRAEGYIRSSVTQFQAICQAAIRML